MNKETFVKKWSSTRLNAEFMFEDINSVVDYELKKFIKGELTKSLQILNAKLDLIESIKIRLDVVLKNFTYGNF